MQSNELEKQDDILVPKNQELQILYLPALLLNTPIRVHLRTPHPPLATTEALCLVTQVQLRLTTVTVN